MVFAGAGVDSVLKQSMRSCNPLQVERSQSASEKYVDFVTSYIQEGQSISSRHVARLLIDPRPESALRDAYIRTLTGSSLQS